MKKIGIILLVLLLCGGLLACTQAQSAQDAFYRSPEGAMIGRTFREVEAAFGPFSMIYYEADRPAAYVFSRTNVTFHFDAPQIESAAVTRLAGDTGYIPGAIALRYIQPQDLCVGVSGRIRDFGIADSDVEELSTYMRSFTPTSTETATNTVYTVTTLDQACEVYIYCAHGEQAVTPDHQIRVMAAGTVTAPDPQVTEFSFADTLISVGATEVEIRGTSKARKTVTAREFGDLVRYCPNLKSLVLDYCDVAGEEQVGQLTGLTRLEIMSCNIPDISFVRHLTQLTRLGVCHNHISDISAIEDLPLTYLNIADNPNLGNSALRSVAQVTTLDTLYIYTLNISSLTPLRSLKGLSLLNVNNDAKIDEEDLMELSRLSNLRKLQINGTGVTSLDFLADCFPNLRELEARKMNKLIDPNRSFLDLTLHPHLKKLTVSKDLKESLDADTWASYGMDAKDWFKSQNITITFS